VIRPLGVGWDWLDQKARMPRALALFWPLLPAGLFMVGMLLLGQLGLALALTLIWLLLTLPFSAHPRLLRRIEIRDGVLTYRRWLGPRLRVRLADLDRALICQISPFMAYGNYWVPVGAMGGGAPHLYLLDRKGRLRLRLLLVRYRPEHLEQLLAAIPVKVIREGPLTSSQFRSALSGGAAPLPAPEPEPEPPGAQLLSRGAGAGGAAHPAGILISDLISSLVQHHP
jgi:hypothetical protein